MSSSDSSEPALAHVAALFELQGVLWTALRLYFGVISRAADSPLTKACTEDLKPEKGEECIVKVASMKLTMLETFPTYFDPTGAMQCRDEAATTTFYYR